MAINYCPGKLKLFGVKARLECIYIINASLSQVVIVASFDTLLAWPYPA